MIEVSNEVVEVVAKEWTNEQYRCRVYESLRLENSHLIKFLDRMLVETWNQYGEEIASLCCQSCLFVYKAVKNQFEVNEMEKNNG